MIYIFHGAQVSAKLSMGVDLMIWRHNTALFWQTFDVLILYESCPMLHVQVLRVQYFLASIKYILFYMRKVDFHLVWQLCSLWQFRWTAFNMYIFTVIVRNPTSVWYYEAWARLGNVVVLIYSLSSNIEESQLFWYPRKSSKSVDST